MPPPTPPLSPPSPQRKKLLGWLSTEEYFCEFIQQYIPKLRANKLCSANLP